ncbi:DUF397 domain-containing protein [Streptomyces triculaminicus]|uniref:DUF397 domain-containing protein n=1 Tax=Streptomyces triculaminicus TaxID=2816232 RepID=UPI0033F5B415
MNAPGQWQKSSFSGGGPDNSCVELRALGDAVAIRESDEPKAILTARAAGVRALLRSVKADALGA